MPKGMTHTGPLVTRRAAFALRHQLTPVKWSGRNLTILLRSTGERPQRLDEMRELLGWLGLGESRTWPGPGGVFDHGEMWARSGRAVALVGHPYQITADERVWLAELARYPTLRVAVDDEPSYYGYRTHHVRVEVIAPCRPFVRGVSSRTTRQAAHRARRAFAEEWGNGPFSVGPDGSLGPERPRPPPWSSLGEEGHPRAGDGLALAGPVPAWLPPPLPRSGNAHRPRGTTPGAASLLRAARSLPARLTEVESSRQAAGSGPISVTVRDSPVTRGAERS